MSFSSLPPIPQPLAPVQSAMLRVRDGGEEVEQVVVVFRGGVDPSRVVAAWLATVAATEVLRCGFRMVQGEAVGLESRVPAEVMAVVEGEPVSVAAWLEEDRRREFPWEEGVPWRVAWWPEARRWVWTFHHGLLDGRSLVRIMQSFLRRVCGGEVPPLRLARWTAATPSEQAAAAAHFRAVFSGLGPAAIDFAGSGRGVAVECLGGGCAEALEAVAARAGVTVATILLWAWGQVVSRAAGVEVVALGQVRSGPPDEGVAGFSMNTLPLVVRRLRAGAVAGGWRALREQMLALRSFERVAPEAVPAAVFRTADGPWSGTVMIDRGTLRHRLGEDADAVVESLELHERPSGGLVASAHVRPDLRLEVEAGDGIGPEGAATLLAHWGAVVRAAAATPEADAAEVTRLPRAMEAQLAEWGDGGPPLPGPVHLADAWREAVAAHGGQTSVWTPEEAWSFEDTSERVDRLMDSLAGAGAGPGATVAVRLARRAGWLVTLLAVTCLGAVYLPLARRTPTSRLRSMVESAEAEVLVCAAGETDDFGLRRVLVEGAGAAPPVRSAVRTVASGQMLALLYTSGSTGVPKGVLLEHRGVLNEARWAARTLGLGPGERLLQFASPGFDASLEEMLACVVSGATLVSGPGEIAEDFEVFQEFIGAASVTVLDLPTAFWSAWSSWLRQTGRRVPAPVRTAIIGGEKATGRALADWRAAGGGALWNSYGPTEASIVATAQEIGQSWLDDDDPPIGRPLPGCVVRVVDDCGLSMPPGAVGEIWIGGPGVGPGYLGLPDLTASAFVVRDGVRWYRTGDRARWDAGGRLRFLGRLDDQVKIRGHRVEPGLVVHGIESFPGVVAAHAGAVGPPDRPVLAAWVRWAEPVPENWPKRLREHLLGHLPAAAVPVRWAAVPGFVLTESGKLDRRALPEPRVWGGEAAEAPVTPTERRLAAFWSELLGVEQADRQDSFFDLGGDSLQALRLFAWLAEDGGVKLPMATLMQSPTLAGLARVVDELAGREEGVGEELASAVLPLRAEPGAPPLFCIHGGDGGVFFYRELARHLPAEASLLTIEAPALSAAEVVRTRSVEESAAGYVEAVRRHQPGGPYRLAGYSYGGVLVYEMAAQLRAAGEEVSFLGMFDTGNPAVRPRRLGLLERAATFSRAMAGQPWWIQAGRLLGRTAGGIRTNLTARLESLAARHAGVTRPHSRLRALQVREAHAAAMDAYMPRPIDVPVLLFRTAAVDDKFEIMADYGWGGMTPELEVVVVPGAHLTMFSPEYASRLALEVGTRLGAIRS